jgi:hypothetical protein
MKYDKKAVQFEHPAKGMDKCSGCSHFLNPDGCEIVSGIISPKDWCNQFMRKNESVHLKQNEQAPDKCGSGSKQMPYNTITEHQTVHSRNTGRDIEIGFGPQPGGLVPSNPFASLAQAGYMHSHPEILGSKIKEWDQATKGKKLPKRVKK